MQADAERCKVSVDDAIAELVKLGFANMFDYMRIGENGDPFLSTFLTFQATALAEFTVEDGCSGREARQDQAAPQDPGLNRGSAGI